MTRDTIADVRVTTRRWWDKSAIGRPKDDVLLLSPTDVVFAHDHRGMEWPSRVWFPEALRKRPSLIHESLVNEALRQPGNKVLWYDHFDEMDFEFSEDTQALRWDAKNHPARGPPDAVKLETFVLATNSGYAPSNNSTVPAAAYPVSAYVISLLPSDLTSLTAKL